MVWMHGSLVELPILTFGLVFISSQFRPISVRGILAVWFTSFLAASLYLKVGREGGKLSQ